MFSLTNKNVHNETSYFKYLNIKQGSFIKLNVLSMEGFVLYSHTKCIQDIIMVRVSSISTTVSIFVVITLILLAILALPIHV